MIPPWKTFFTLSLAATLLETVNTHAAITILSPAASANLRHDSFGFSYTNVFGNGDLYANLNSINDDRAAIEFPLFSIPANSIINSATLRMYVFSGGGVQGSTGTFNLFGYTGDGGISMNDYYSQQVLLTTFTEGVPPAFGFTNFVVTSFIQNLNHSGSGYGGFLFQALSQNVLVGFPGPGQPAYPQPILTVDFTPVPEPNRLIILAVAASLFYFWHPQRNAI